MKSKLFALLLASSSVSFVSASARDADLGGVWFSQCETGERDPCSGGVSGRRFSEFQANTHRWGVVGFEGANCTGQMSGKFFIEREILRIGTGNFPKEIDYSSATRIRMVPLTSAAEALFRANLNCGTSDWQVGIERDADSCFDSRLKQMPIYSIVGIENDRLMNGEFCWSEGCSTDGTTPARRPTRLDTTDIYQKFP